MKFTGFMEFRDFVWDLYMFKRLTHVLNPICTRGTKNTCSNTHMQVIFLPDFVSEGNTNETTQYRMETQLSTLTHQKRHMKTHSYRFAYTPKNEHTQTHR